MDLIEKDVLGEEAGSHWYYVSKGRAIVDLLGHRPIERLLDIGAGSGIFSRQLLKRGLVDQVVCVDTGYEQESDESSSGHKISFVRSTTSRNFDLVLMIDVLEHVDDDLSFLRNYVDGLPVGTKVVICVPAFRFLWSGHDDFLGHKRRYTRRQLQDVATSAGLSVVKCRYFFALILPVVAFIRMVARALASRRYSARRSDLVRHSRLSNFVLTRIHDIERKAIFPLNRFGGLSVMCLARVERRLG